MCVAVLDGGGASGRAIRSLPRHHRHQHRDVRALHRGIITTIITMATTMNPALQRKLQKVLEMEVDGAAATVSVSSSASSTCSVTLQDSLRHIGTRFYSTNDVTARRNLRSNIEKTTLDINLSFLAALEQVQVVCVSSERTSERASERDIACV